VNYLRFKHHQLQ